ncbi:MAG: nitrilase-related carbon-nitrogen hydrolase [Thermodesulfobacteriota bacterium]|nr:nitrilase-related carbon-nitrogen hydrolase [Thermodesulfobacteriota bacterium]
MKVGFIQFGPVFGDIEGNIDTVKRLVDGADADILVLPELFNTGYLFTSHEEVEKLSEEIPGGKTTEALCELAQRKNVWIVGGLAERSGKNIYNSAVLVGPKGYRAVYRKIHLFFEEKVWFQPGERGFEVHDIGWCKIGIMICFDWIFPESMRVLSLMGADVVCHSSNLVLSYCQDAMKTRCLENRVFAVTANRTGTEKRGGKSLYYTGKSQVTGTDGGVLLRAGEAAEEVGIVEIDVNETRTKEVNEYNDLFGDRRPELYRIITESDR